MTDPKAAAAEGSHARPLPSGPTKASRGRRALRTALWAAAALFGLYLAAGNLFLRPSIGPRLLYRPGREREIGWKNAWTVVPGVAHVRGFSIDDRTRRLAWRLEVDQATAQVSLPSLLGRRFRARIAGDGLSFRAVEAEGREGDPSEGGSAESDPASVGAPPDSPPTGALPARRPAPALPAAEPAPATASLPSSASPAGHPTSPAPDGAVHPPAATPSPASSRGPGWTFDFPAISVSGVREIAVRDFVFTGQARLEGSFRTTVRGPFEIPSLRLLDADGRLTRSGEPVAERLTGEVEASCPPFVYREHRGRPGLRFLSGGARLAGEGVDLDLLDGLFARAPWLDLEGRGRVETELRVGEGRLAAGSRLAAEVPDLALVYLGLRAHGAGEVTGRIEEGEVTPLVVEAKIAEFAVDRIEPPEPYLTGQDFTWRVAGGTVDLAGDPPELDVAVDLPDAEVPDLRVYNAFLPARSGLAVTRGRGRLAAHLELSTRVGARGDGSVRLSASGVGLRFREVALTGDLAVDARLADADPRERTFEVGGTRVRLERVRIGEAPPGWWGELTFDAARLALRSPVTGRARARISLRDTGPLFALFAQDRPVVRLAGSLLEVRDLAGTATVGLTGQAVALDDLHLTGGEDFAAEARICFAEKRAQGVLYLRRKRLAVAAELVDGERHWDLLKAREWYEERLRRHRGERCGG